MGGVVVEFRLLGPVELWAHGRQIKLPSPKLKQLLAALLLDAGNMVPTDTLIHRLWDEDAPRSEKTSLHTYVSRLRRVLEQCGEPSLRVDYISLGYRLVGPVERLDVRQFRQSFAQARAAAERNDLAEALRRLNFAEGLVHGEPLAGLPGDWARDRRSELEEEIHTAALLRIELQLTADPRNARDLLAELRGHAAKREFDESVLALLMRALGLAGRASEALHAYGAYRERLREQSGLNPGAALQQLYARLLRDEPAKIKTSAPKPHAVEPPNTLDPNPQTFVGRHRDVAAITGEIEAQLASGGSAVFVVDGMPGIGKTTLALHTAYQLRERCPDGAMQLHLRGHDDKQRPTSPAAALGLLLGMLGVESRQIQHAGSLDVAIALWRRHSAGKRLLLLLDDAASAEQIAPLIPSGAGSIVLVTTRNRLVDLPEAPLHLLEPMLDDEAGQLLVRSARMAPTRDPALRDVVAACGGFPLALAVAGKILRTRQAWSIGDLADHLARSRTAHPRKPDAIISPLFRVFSTSYRDLPEFERVLLRRLSLNPGLRIHLQAVAALVDAEPSETDAALFNLVEQNLLAEPERRYYQLHDMVRIFAAHMCEIEEDPAELEAAANRLMYFTIGAVDSATKLFHSHRHVILSETVQDQDFHDGIGFSDSRQATKWLESQQAWLRTVIEHWFSNGHPQEAATIVSMLSRFLDRKSLWKESIDLHQSALAAWHDCGNMAGEARSRTELAGAHWRLGDVVPALDNATEALRLWSALGDEEGLADAQLQVGRAHHAQHHNAAAIDCFTFCARYWRNVGDHQAAASALHHLASAQFEAGLHEKAFDTLEEALELANLGQDLTVKCNCLNTLGIFLLRLGDHVRAAHYLRRALPLADQIGDRNRSAAFALNLAVCETRLDRPESALPLLERAHETFSTLGDQFHLTTTLIAEAEAHLGLRRSRTAQALIDSAAVLAERFGDPEQLARLHVIHGRIFATHRSYPAALHAFQLALDFAHTAAIPYLTGIACRQIGDLHDLLGEPDTARRYWREALDVYDGISTPEVDELRRKSG
jgi:DNA-binding SARP family transcriptional activator/tetratricopeptide (TPR) repeat protein